MNKLLKLLTLITILVVSISAVFILKNSEKTYYGDLYQKEAPDFSLTNHDGELFNLSDIKGKVILMNFGYTSCPDVCPTTLAILRNVLVELENPSDVKVVFVSVDPERDTVEKLNKYIPYFHNDIIGLTGTTEQIEQVSSMYNIIYFKEDEKSDKDYLMSHSPSIYLIDKSGELFLKYPQHKMDHIQISNDIKELL